jgi:hypothetical protein
MNDNTRSRLLDAVPAILAVACLAGSCYFWFQLAKPEYGMFYGVFDDPPSNGLSPAGPNHFELINTWYFVISFCLLIYLILRQTAKTWHVYALRILVLAIATFPLLNMLDYKYPGPSYSRPEWWLQVSLYFDVFAAAAILAIIGIEIFSLIAKPKSQDKPVLQTQ